MQILCFSGGLLLLLLPAAKLLPLLLLLAALESRLYSSAGSRPKLKPDTRGPTVPGSS
jgi:hypothetical protein